MQQQEKLQTVENRLAAQVKHRWACCGAAESWDWQRGSIHMREGLQPRTDRRENIPQISSVSQWRRGKLFIFCVATSKEAEAHRMTAKPRRPVKFHREAGWRYRPGLGLSQLFHISEGGPSGAEGTGSANRFGAGPPIQRDD